MSRMPCLGNKLWWEAVERGGAQLYASEIKGHDVAPDGYKHPPQPSYCPTGQDCVEPTPPKPHFAYTVASANRVPNRPTQKVKTSPFVSAQQQAPGQRAILRDENGCEVIDSVKGVLPSVTRTKATQKAKQATDAKSGSVLQDNERDENSQAGAFVPLHWRI